MVNSSEKTTVFSDRKKTADADEKQHMQIISFVLLVSNTCKLIGV